jgi:LacI family transcriptional regulator
MSGVARTTVSRVLNNRPNVRPQVRERVERAVAELGYKVNPQARTLAGGRSRTLALICSTDEEAEPNSYYRSALEVGALRACSRDGLQLITQSVVQTAPDRGERILALIDDARASGAVLTPPFCDDPGLVQTLSDHGCAVVSISPGMDARALAPSVGIDDETAGADIAEHLLVLGHRRLGFLQGIAGHLSAERRQYGVERALADHGIDPAALRLARGDFTFRSGKTMLPHLLDGRVTAVICANDDMAAGALFAAHQLDIDVPRALSITGFDDTPVSAIVWPPLTTVHQPLQRLGERAVQMMADLLRVGSTGLATASEMLPHEVKIRGTSDVPPPGSD